jgi:carboxypeptidase Q
MPRLLALTLSLSAAVALADDKPEKPDLAVVHRIKEEAFRHGQVMDHLFWLTDANGPRLTGSPGWKSAGDWAVKTLAGWGASQPHLESWGKFGRSWQVTRYELNLLSPSWARLGGVPKAWSSGTKGAISGPLVLAPLFPDKEDRDDALDLGKLAARIREYARANKGKLRGHFVLLDPRRDLTLPKEPIDPQRFDDKKLGEISQAPEPVVPEPYEWPLERLPRDSKKRQALVADLPREILWDYFERRGHVQAELWKFLKSEGVLGVFSTDDRGEGSLVFAESSNAWEASETLPPALVVLAPEEYDRLTRLVDRKLAPKVQLDLAVNVSDKDVDGYNVVAELPGGKKKDELVMIGAHLDSWHGGTGATDNGVGSAVMLEAFRILKTLGLQMDRTVRIALWSGEEQMLYGSRGYVKAHFGDPITMQLKPEHGKLAGYFNLDYGSGKIRGVYLQGNDMVRPIFEAWLAPWKDQGAGSLSIRSVGGTDHLSFDDVGLPGFQFIQDPLDYSTRTHHSTLDVYEHASPGDLMQAAAIVASFVYNAANRAEPLPRKPLPPPLPPKKAH